MGDGWPVISDFSPPWVHLPQRLMQCFLMHIHRSNKEIRSRSTRVKGCSRIKETALFFLLEFTLPYPVFKWELRRLEDCWEKVNVLWHSLSVPFIRIWLWVGIKNLATYYCNQLSTHFHAFDIFLNVRLSNILGSSSTKTTRVLLEKHCI